MKTIHDGLFKLDKRYWTCPCNNQVLHEDPENMLQHWKPREGFHPETYPRQHLIMENNSIFMLWMCERPVLYTTYRMYTSVN